MARPAGSFIWYELMTPGGSWIVVAADPHGAVFGLVGPKGQ